MISLPLKIAIASIALSLICEKLLHFSKFGWKYRKYFGGMALITNAFGAGAFAAETLSGVGILVVFLSFYRSVNLLRLFQEKMHEKYLSYATKKSFLIFGIFETGLIIYWFVLKAYRISATWYLEMVAILVTAAALLLMLTTIVNLLSTRLKNKDRMSIEKWPTLSLVIPARNEDIGLKECLQSVLASDYPKLEILVYDDCSQDKTAEIIKSFAHDGVRFVPGEKPGDIWLAKNLAYETLLQHASGEILMFIGVDVRLGYDTISRLVDYLESNKLNMVSVMPRRMSAGLTASLIQPIRYWWELAMPKWFLKRPPVLSTCWLVRRKELIDNGGFKSVTRAIIPEEHFAWNFNKTKTYKFVRSNDKLGLFTQKDFLSQWQTAVRTRYPQVHKRPEILAFKTIFTTLVLLAPFAWLGLNLVINLPLLINILAIISAAALIISHVCITFAANPSASYISLINFPLTVLLDLAAMHVSMYRYEFSEVIWKGRNIAIPAMHVYPRLPEI